jgi:hypothetical protein
LISDRPQSTQTGHRHPNNWQSGPPRKAASHSGELTGITGQKPYRFV